MTERAFTIRYNCGHRRAWPLEEAPAEIGRAIGRRPCPDCRQPWTPPEPRVTYRFAVAGDGAPLALPAWSRLYLCDFHDEEATAKGVETPEGVDRRVGVILPVTKAGLMLCSVCDGDVAIVPTARATADTSGGAVTSPFRPVRTYTEEEMEELGRRFGIRKDTSPDRGGFIRIPPQPAPSPAPEPAHEAGQDQPGPGATP